MKKEFLKTAIFLCIGLFSLDSFAFDIKGFNITESQGYQYDANPAGAANLPAQDAVDYLYGLGVRHVVLTPEALMARGNSSEVVPNTPPEARGDEKARYLRLIRYIHGKGMTVGIRPIVLVTPSNDNAGSWHGNITPKNPDKWFDSMSTYLGIYADIAKTGSVEEMTVGAELQSMTVGIGKAWPLHPNGFPKEWLKIVRSLKKNFNSTRVMYDINYTDDIDHNELVGKQGGELERWRNRLVDMRPADINDTTSESAVDWGAIKSLWLELDLVGLDIYRSLMSANEIVPNDYNLLVGKLQQRADQIVSDLDAKLADIARSVGSSKKVLVKETGFKSCTKCFIDPFEYEDPRNEVNIPHQAAAYQAIFNAYLGAKWLAGMTFWELAIDPSRTGANESGFTPRGKTQTENVIKAALSATAPLNN